MEYIPIAFANGDGTWTVYQLRRRTRLTSRPGRTSQGFASCLATSTGTGSPTLLWCARRRAGGSIPIAFANGDGTWNVTNGAAGPDFIPSWANQPGVRLVPGDFNGNGLTDIALVRQTPGGVDPDRVRERRWDLESPTAPRSAEFIPRLGESARGSAGAGRLQRQRADRHCPGASDTGWGPSRSRSRTAMGLGTSPMAPRVRLHRVLGESARGAAGAGRLQRQRADRHCLVRQTPGGVHPDRVRERRRDLEHHQRRRRAGLHPVLGEPARCAARARRLQRQRSDRHRLVRDPWVGFHPIAFANGDGTWNVTNGATGPDFIRSWANSPGCGWSPATSADARALIARAFGATASAGTSRGAEAPFDVMVRATQSAMPTERERRATSSVLSSRSAALAESAIDVARRAPGIGMTSGSSAAPRRARPAAG